MNVLELDFSDLDDLPLVDFDPGAGMQSLAPKPAPDPKKCRCCERPVYAPRAVYCSPKSTCRSRYHRNPTRYQQQNATGVSSVASPSLEDFRRIVREEIAAAGGGSYRPAAAQPRTPVKSATPDLDLLESIEIKTDKNAAARSSQNLRNSLWALYSGTGAFANTGA